MTIFTVHVPRDPVEPRVLAERVRFVADEFSWGAFIFGPLWLLCHGLWLALFAWIVAEGFVGFLAVLGVPPLSLFGLSLAIAFLFGLEGNAILASALAGRGFALRDLVAASGRDAAERYYFRRLTQARPVTTAAGRTPSGSGGRDEFVGLSPDAGG